MTSTLTEPSIASLIRKHRTERGLTQEALARNAGVTVSSIARIETRATASPQTATLRRIAGALGVSINDLIPEQGVEPTGA